MSDIKTLKIGYDLSRDYGLLFDKLCEGYCIVGFVDYNFTSLKDKYPPSRDVVSIKRRAEFVISIGVRGIQYGGIECWHKYQGKERDVFIKECESLNLEWVNIN